MVERSGGNETKDRQPFTEAGAPFKGDGAGKDLPEQGNRTEMGLLAEPGPTFTQLGGKNTRWEYMGILIGMLKFLEPQAGVLKELRIITLRVCADLLMQMKLFRRELQPEWG